MIIPSNGEVSFEDGLRITAHSTMKPLLDAVPPDQRSRCSYPVQGWNRYDLGKHTSSYGSFDVWVVTGSEHLVEAVFLCHDHPFYESKTPEDSERRAFHEGIISTDLFGQREFSWGHGKWGSGNFS